MCGFAQIFASSADSNADVRRAAVEGLVADWPDESTTLELVRERAAIDADADVRWAAVEALASGWPDDPGAIEVLRQLAPGTATASGIRDASSRPPRPDPASARSQPD